MAKFYNIVIFFLVLLILISFFLPWVKVESSEAVGSLFKALTGKKATISQAISAYQVPVMANDENARLMITIIKIFDPRIENADKKSYLIWSISVLAVLIFLVSLFFGRNKWVNLAFGIIGSLIFIIAAYKIKTTDLDKQVLKITMGPGLWLTLWGYLGIGIVGLIEFFRLLKKKA